MDCNGPYEGPRGSSIKQSFFAEYSYKDKCVLICWSTRQGFKTMQQMYCTVPHCARSNWLFLPRLYRQVELPKVKSILTSVTSSWRICASQPRMLPTLQSKGDHHMKTNTVHPSQHAPKKRLE